MKQTYITLNNGTKIPQFGMGVFLVPAGDATRNACLEALKLGCPWTSFSQSAAGIRFMPAGWRSDATNKSHGGSGEKG